MYAEEDKLLVDGYLFLHNYPIATSASQLEVKTSGLHKKPAEPTIYLYKFLIPQNDSKELNWKGRTHIPTVRVIDRFGNSGEFQLGFNNEANFDVPGII